jgi:metal-responsive CopG/Arc/MetJ family transcriptional regulator
MISEVDALAEKDGRSRSDMINILLGQALKERERQRVKNQSKKKQNDK